MIYFVLVLFFMFFLFYFIRSVYLSSISVVKVVSTDSTYIDYYVVPIKPNKRFFKNEAAGKNSSCVSLGNSYYAYYVNESDQAILTFENFEFCSNVIIFKRSRFGRFVSIDMSDRCLNDLIKKFKGV